MLLRRGYLKGRGAIRSRRILRDASWVSGIIGEIYGSMNINFAKTVHMYHLHRFGSESLAERNLHDFYLNVRIFAKEGRIHPRIALFAAFSGLGLEGSTFGISEPSSLALLATRQAHTFFLHALKLVSKECYGSSVHSDRDANELPLIPISRIDSELVAELWLASPDVLKRAANAIFLDAISKSDKRELERKIDESESMNASGHLEVNVDSFMVEIVKIWIMIAKENLDRLEKYCQRDHVDEEALFSLDGFQYVVSHCNLVDSPHLRGEFERKAITRAEYLQAISAVDGTPPVEPLDALLSALKRRCLSGFAGTLLGGDELRVASIVRQTEQLEIAYGQYKAPLQQFLKEALRAKAEEEEAHEAGEEDAPEASGVVMGVEQCATKVRSSLVAFEQQLAAVRLASIKVKDNGLDWQDQDSEGVQAVEAGWEAFQQLMAKSFLLQRRTAPPNRPAKEAIRDAWATPVSK
jgi:hypothetical protein